MSGFKRGLRCYVLTTGSRLQREEIDFSNNYGGKILNSKYSIFYNKECKGKKISRK